MKRLHIYCEENNFNALAAAFEGVFESDIDLAAEIVFVEAEEIQRLNKEMRQVDKVTDVLSFPTLDGILKKKILKKKHISDIDEEGNLFIGSIAICKQRAAEQAEEYGHSYTRELFYLATHGVCHLLGYDHMEEQEKAQMRAVEEAVLAKIGITRDSQ